MTDDKDDPLDPDLDLALRSLPRERRPPAALADRIVESLRSEGLLRPARASRPARHPWMQIAASILLLALGFASGAWWTGDRPAPATGMPRFLLLLHEDPGQFAAPSPEELAAIIDEYKAWAAEGARSGFLLDGVKLKDDGRVLPDPDAGSRPLATGAASEQAFIGGYFVVQASGYDEAVRLARTCPHLRYGGRIEIREVDPV